MSEEKKDKSLPELEKEILAKWERERIFEKSLKQNAKNKTFVFYEGPPTANGKPGLHHVLARSYKDIICRYKNMRGFNVPRRAGWDTHGLPVELQVEKELGLKSKKDIENLIPENKTESIKKFNEKCRASVWQYKELWENLTSRMGYWLNTENPYITYESEYIESVWWLLSEIYKKGLLYEGHKIIPWCPRCGTGLSSHELAQGYKVVKDNSIFLKFKLLPGQKINNYKIGNKTFILSWTTTPWTLPGNVALAIGKKIKYSLLKSEDGTEAILASSLSDKNIFAGKKIKEFSGSDLIGLKYEPLFKIKEFQSEKSYQIYPADFVTTTDGAGVVHTAVMYGEDDYQLGKEVGLPEIHTVDESGRFKDFVPELSGLFVKSKETEEKIIAYLKKNNFFLSENLYEHDYPFCWRCDTPVIYFARSSWFIRMSSLKNDLLKNNEKINWVPSHIKEGRFGEWLKDIKDWALSRERYWGTPLPVWQCHKCGQKKIISSLKELANSPLPSKNSYFAIRHGEALSNKNKFNSSWPEKTANSLTKKGRLQIEKSAKKLKKLNIDVIISSDLKRTKETAEIIKKSLKIKTLIFDERLRETDFGKLNGNSISSYKKIFSSYKERYEKSPENGENLNQVRRRIVEALKEIDKTYENKRILIVSHEDPLRILAESLSGNTLKNKEFFLKNGEFKPLPFKNIPLNDNGFLDPHRPFIDEIKIPCSCGEKMKRAQELVDVWFDSGAMPFASIGYPLKNKDLIEKKKLFPADYISEAMDQTRGWFYTLLAISTLLEKGAPYKNVISLGLINDKNGKKMSKSRGNIIDPWEMFNKYGADSVRWYLFTLNDAGETKNFDENDLKKVSLNIFNIIKNCLLYLKTYGFLSGSIKKFTNPLDLWLASRVSKTVKETGEFIEKYNIPPAGRKIEELINDISRWFIRRSRSRFQGQADKKDLINASFALYNSLLVLSKIMAPFAPFFSDYLYLSLNSLKKESGLKKSVHLSSWPKIEKINEKLIKEMDLVKKWSSLGLAERSALGIKIRQPLSEIKIKSAEKISANLLKILKDEVNVKKISLEKNLPDEKEILFDLNITPELKSEGLVREFIRFIQSLRGEAKLKPGELVNLYIESAPENLSSIFSLKEKEICSACSLKKIFFSKINTQKINKTAPFENFGEISVSLK
ncbi:MAG: class I tRNA ligase family protein [Candidatus Pacebacteria bacterium]|nr:class I tRNA ligase family protein [Candidatus Paceibacterota bacterium]